MRISIIIARGLLAEACERGIQVDDLMVRCGLDRARLQDLRETLSMEEADRLICGAIQLTADEGLGLAVGASAPDSMLQVLGQVLSAQRTLRDALGALNHYAPLLADGLSFELVEHGAEARLRVSSLVDMGSSSRFLTDYALVICRRLILSFAPRDAALLTLRLRHAPPSYAERYAHVFACTVQFAQGEHVLTFAREHLDRVQFHADDMVREHASTLADRLLATRTHLPGVAERVRTILRFERKLHTVTLSFVAQQMGLSKRELRRKLTAERSPFVSLLAAARCRTACEHIRRGELSIKEIGSELGYSEPSAFHRAFKRWTGQTPTEYATRRAQEAPPAATLVELAS
jgi:AraC-like DNA-binding protein